MKIVHPPLIGKCDGCGSEHGLLQTTHPTMATYTCPTCQNKRVMTEAAENSLSQLLRTTLHLWHSKWGATLNSLDNYANLDDITRDAMESAYADFQEALTPEQAAD